MDTDGLASGLSLAGFLLIFLCLALAESAPTATTRKTRSVRAAIPSLLRLAAATAAAVSTLSVLASQGATNIAAVSGASIGLLAFLLLLDFVGHAIGVRLPRLAMTLATPIHAISGARPRNAGDSANGSWLNGGGRANGSGASMDTVLSPEQWADLDSHERFMIRSIMRLDEATVREVMVPRVDVVAVEKTTSVPEVGRRMQESGHTRLPVYSGNIDNVVGVVYARDLLLFLGQAGDYPALEKMIRPAFFIPEFKRLDELLRELQSKRVQMALVVDEYGGIEGLVTLEDLLEEIVGEIEDEFSRSQEPRVVPLANGDIIVDARVSLDQLSELLATQIQSEDVDTVGGLVYSGLGKIPHLGDTVSYDGLTIEVVSLLGRRIRRLRLRKTASNPS